MYVCIYIIIYHLKKRISRMLIFIKLLNSIGDITEVGSKIIDPARVIQIYYHPNSSFKLISRKTRDLIELSYSYIIFII